MENENPRDEMTETDQEREDYRSQLFRHIPLYTTRLVQKEIFCVSARYQVSTPGDIAIILEEYFRDKDREVFLVCLLDSSNSLVSLCPISTGGLSSSIVEPRQVFKVAILSNAAAMILAHNHPSGNLEPSREDIAISKQLKNCGEMMGIAVYDHLIISSGGYLSLRERGLL